MELIDYVLRETTTITGYDEILAKRKNKPQETLSAADKLLLAGEQEFERENPIRTANHLCFHNLRALIVRARIRNGKFFYDMPDFIKIENKLYGFEADIGISMEGHLYLFESVARTKRYAFLIKFLRVVFSKNIKISKDIKIFL
jgi:hypothetical protein